VGSPVAEYLKPSFQYDVLLDSSRDPPYTLPIAVSQVVKADEVDRFTFRVMPKPLKPFEIIYKVAVSLRYDSGQKETATRELVLVLPDLSKSPPDYFYSDFEAQARKIKQEPQMSAWMKELLTLAQKAAVERSEHNLSAIRAAAESSDPATWSPRMQQLVEKMKAELITNSTLQTPH
jgi:hypothetical protein